MGQGHYFRLFSPIPPSPFPAWRRRLVDGAGEEEGKPLPGAPEHRATPAHLQLGRRRNWARRARYAGAGRPRRRAGERRGAGGGPPRGPAHPDPAFALRCPGDAVSWVKPVQF